MAKINFNKIVFRDMKNKPVVYRELKEGGNPEKQEDFVEVTKTIADMISAQLGREAPQATPTERHQRYALGLKIGSATVNESVNFTVEELELIKKAAGESTFPLVVGRIQDAVEDALLTEPTEPAEPVTK